MTVKELRDYAFSVDSHLEVKILQCCEDDLREGVPVKSMYEVRTVCGEECKPMLVLVPYK